MHQDPPAMINNFKDLPPGIEDMSHDLFAPQPIQGTKAYYLHSILHN